MYISTYISTTLGIKFSFVFRSQTHTHTQFLLQQNQIGTESGKKNCCQLLQSSHIKVIYIIIKLPVLWSYYVLLNCQSILSIDISITLHAIQSWLWRVCNFAFFSFLSFYVWLISIILIYLNSVELSYSELYSRM